MKITTRTGTYYGETELQTIIEAHDGDTLASALYADPITGQIMAIETEAGYQRQGLATALVQYAVDHGIELYHSPAWACTDEGAAFAESCSIIDTIADEDAYGWADYQAIAA